jgi:polysaccharide pyruvyl transferase WcaK-like protein
MSDPGDIGSTPSSRASRSVAGLARYWSSPDPDGVFLQDLVERMVEARARRVRKDGPPRRALILGYAGAGNTGADLRAIETILQLRRHLPDLHMDLYALGTVFDHPVLAAMPKLKISRRYFPDFLDATMSRYDLVLNVEGSTYTSTFSDSLAATLIGGLGLAAAHGAHAIAYGVDSGRMSPALASFSRQSASDVTVIVRNDAAGAHLASLGIATLPGADPGWRYRDPAFGTASPDRERTVAICPSNAFWWPAVSDVARAAQLDASGETSWLRYGTFHFHSWDDQRAAAYERYIDELARLVRDFARRGLKPVLVGMDRLDAAACADVAARVAANGQEAPRLVVRGDAPMTQVLEALTRAEGVVTTRFHAALVAISHGVPVFGLAVDERIERLLTDAGAAAWWARADAPELSSRVLESFDRLFEDGAERAALRERQLGFAARQSALFDAMTAHLPPAGGA